MATSKKSAGPIELQKLERRKLTFYIIGETPLIVHAWSQKVLTQMLAKQMGQKIPRFPKRPVQDFLDSLYHMDNGNYGFPATAIKRALVDTCTSMSNEITKVAARQALYVESGRGTAISAFSGTATPIQLIPLYCPVAPQMREDSVKLNGRTPDIRYRGEFFPWAMILNIIFNAKVITQATVANLLDTAGFACGLGEWRQERGGINGQFRLATDRERKEIDKWTKKKPIQPEVSAIAEKEFLERLQDDIKRYGEVVPDEEALAEDEADTRRGKRNGAAKEVRQ